MLLTRANELVAAIRGMGESERRVKHVQGIQSISQTLSERAARISTILGSRSALVARGCSFPISASFAKAALAVLLAVRQRIEADASASADPQAFAQIWPTLNRVIAELEASLRSTWSAYADERIPALNSEVLDVLRRIEDLRPQVDRVERRLADLKARRNTLPTRPEEIAAFDALVQEVESLWRSLGGDSLPDEVLRFLQDSGTGGASLDSLTPTVTGWLHEHRLWAAFRVTIAREIPRPGSGR